VVGVGLVGAVRTLVGVVGAMAAVGCQRTTTGVVVGGQELVLVGALSSKHIGRLSSSLS